MTTKPVVFIGMDSADPQLLEDWIAQGHLPNLAQIKQGGAYSRIHNTVFYGGKPASMDSTEVLWPTFVTGCRASTTGNWDINKYDPTTYKIAVDVVDPGYDYETYPPFYNYLGEQRQAIVFDLPYAPMSDQLQGIQVLGWGGTYPYLPNASQPPELFAEILARYGENPIIYNDNGLWWDSDYIEWEKTALQQSTSARASICRDLMRRSDWDLFITAFGDTHTAGHDLYNRSQSTHPLYPYVKAENDPDPLLTAYQAVDRAIGEILTEVPEDAYVCVFSPHGMGPDYTDMPTMAFLPELLYRFSFPGKVAIAPGQVGDPIPPMITKPIRNSWAGEVWSKLYEPNFFKRLWKTWTHKWFLRGRQHGLLSPYALLDYPDPNQEEVALGWMPVMWYSALWPKMKAFALPTYAHGHIRINLKGRERDGIVDAAEYDALCDELTAILYRLKDARTGQPIVEAVYRTRASASAAEANLPDSDLVVVWKELLTDVVDSPDLGRIGPLTHFRAGSHLNRGFFMAKGPGIAPGSTLAESDTVDVPATLLTLMGIAVPDHFEGKPLPLVTQSVASV
jgi:predicted AlkP superfamily phosphohydrolase/phosphomutase